MICISLLYAVILYFTSTSSWAYSHLAALLWLVYLHFPDEVTRDAIVWS